MVDGINQLSPAGVVKQRMIDEVTAGIQTALTQKAFAVKGPEHFTDGTANDLGRVHVVNLAEGLIVIDDGIVDVMYRYAQRQVIEQLGEQFHAGAFGGELVNGLIHDVAPAGEGVVFVQDDLILQNIIFFDFVKLFLLNQI